MYKRGTLTHEQFAFARAVLMHQLGSRSEARVQHSESLARKRPGFILSASATSRKATKYE
jgi:hypothetical protein